VPAPPARATVDLSDYPDLVVMYLGMRVEEPRGVQTLQELGPQGPMLGARSRADADRASVDT
jgi:hypothetical protein